MIVSCGIGVNRQGNEGYICAETVQGAAMVGREIPPAYLTWARRKASGRAARERGFVYFITDGEAIKIGWSHCVWSRCSDLQGANHRELTIIAEFCGTAYEEHLIHLEFKHLNIRREWFRSSPEIYALIDNLRAAEPVMKNMLTTITKVLRGEPPDSWERRSSQMREPLDENRIAFLKWVERGQFPTPEIEVQAKVCALHIRYVEATAPEVMRKSSEKAFAKLEKMQREADFNGIVSQPSEWLRQEAARRD